MRLSILGKHFIPKYCPQSPHWGTLGKHSIVEPHAPSPIFTILRQGLTKFLGLALNLVFTPESPTTESPTASTFLNSWKASMWHKTGLLSYTNTPWVGGIQVALHKLSTSINLFVS